MLHATADSCGPFSRYSIGCHGVFFERVRLVVLPLTLLAADQASHLAMFGWLP